MGPCANLLTPRVRHFVSVFIERIGGRQTDGTNPGLRVRVTHHLIDR